MPVCVLLQGVGFFFSLDGVAASSRQGVTRKCTYFTYIEPGDGVPPFLLSVGYVCSWRRHDARDLSLLSVNDLS